MDTLRFFVSSGIPVADIALELPMPAAARSKLERSLRSGATLEESLQSVGVPLRDAALLNGEAMPPYQLLQLSARNTKMSLQPAKRMAHAFAYPNVIAFLCTLIWFTFSLSPGFDGGKITAFFVATLISILAIQVVPFLPDSLQWKIPFWATGRLLQESHLLFSYLRECFRYGMDETTALRGAVASLGLGRAAGKDSLTHLASGRSFVSVLREMPATAAIGSSPVSLQAIQERFEILADMAEREWERHITRCHAILMMTGLLLAGLLILVLAVRVFAALYTPEIV